MKRTLLRALVVPSCVVVGFGMAFSGAQLFASQNTSRGSSSDNKTPSSTHRQPSRQKLVQLLRQPNGLETAAAQAGELKISEEPHMFARLNLRTLTNESSLIGIATVQDRTSFLADDGTNIRTLVTVNFRSLLKGAKSQQQSVVTIPGGSVAFPNGTSAEIMTTVYNHLREGGTYILFLSVDDDNELVPTNGLEGVWEVNETTKGVRNMTEYLEEDHTHSIQQETRGLDLIGFQNKVTAAITAHTQGQ